MCQLWQAAPHCHLQPAHTNERTIREARAALRFAREQQQQLQQSEDGASSRWRRLAIELPYAPPSNAGLDDVVRPVDAAEWPGGLSQVHRVGARPLLDKLLAGWQPEFAGTIDVGTGVRRLAHGEATAVNHVGDSSVRSFQRLYSGEFGQGPTRPGHTLLLVNPSASAVGQPWDGALRREAAALFETDEWRWLYRAAPLPDDSDPRVLWDAALGARPEYEGSGAYSMCSVVRAADGGPPPPPRLLSLRGGGGRIGSGADLFERPQALATLYHPSVLRLGSGSLGRSSFGRLLDERAALVAGLDACIGAAAQQIDAAASVADPSGGRWVGGRWVADPIATAAKASAALMSLWADERDRASSDHAAWADAAAQSATDSDRCDRAASACGGRADASGADRGASGALEPSTASTASAAAQLAAHLVSCADSVLPRLGSASVCLRSFGWVHASLASADLDGGDAYSGWISAHATRWMALADACDAAFDAAKGALDGGAFSLSAGGALSDVECAVALREGLTSASLVHAVFDGAPLASAGEGTGAGTAGGGAAAPPRPAAEQPEPVAERRAVPPHEEDAHLLEAARQALDEVEPGYVGMEGQTVFIRGVGHCDARQQQTARANAARAYLAAKLEQQARRAG